MWDARMAQKVAERVIMLEESGMHGVEQAPSAAARIHGVDPWESQLGRPSSGPTFSTLVGGRCTTFTMPVMTPNFDIRDSIQGDSTSPSRMIREAIIADVPVGNKLLVTFRAKPRGADKEWKIWDEYIDL